MVEVKVFRQFPTHDIRTNRKVQRRVISYDLTIIMLLGCSHTDAFLMTSIYTTLTVLLLTVTAQQLNGV